MTWNYSEALVTSHECCDECFGKLIESKDDPAEVTMYSREGTSFVKHFVRECANRWCRKRFYCGYSVKDGFKVYEPLDSNSRVLVSSSETAFSVDYLYEVTLHILHSNATFEGLSNIYNQFHNFERENIIRKNLVGKRLASGLFCMPFWKCRIVVK